MKFLKVLTIRNTYFFLFLLSVIILSVAIYLQIEHKLEPCPLCVIQRFLFLILGIICFVAAVHNPGRRGQKVYGYILLIFAILGIIVSLRQIWIQHSPANQVACGAGLMYLLKHAPITESIKLIFKGTGECRHAGPRLFYLTVVEWSLLLFSIFTIVSIIQIARSKRKSWL